jgi:hypothetical protein
MHLEIWKLYTKSYYSRDRIVCQIFCDLLLKSAFEQIFNVMQLILVKIKWHIKVKIFNRKMPRYLPFILLKVVIGIDGIGSCKSNYHTITIWQQIILFSHTVMQMVCMWPKIWTLSGRLSLMHTVQLMKKMSDASKNIFRVYHIRIIAPKKNGSHDVIK